jgi:16S rRNA (cytosine1402-N4)-methyltransferase
MSAWPHTTVLLQESVEALAPRDGQWFVDCTLGCGGHAEALLEAAACTVIGIDRDDDALAISRQRLARFGDRLITVKGSFGDLEKILDDLGVRGVDGVLADLGVSSVQLDTPERGFSFRSSGPIDMRMDSSARLSAQEIVDTWDVESLAECISKYGEERHARRVARAIVQGRPWRDTLQLAEAVRAAIPGANQQRIHPATRTFQALRIAVNDELGELERLLPAALNALRSGGRLALISFHSLEDRIVKRFISHESGRDFPRDPYGNPLGTPRLHSRSSSIVPPPSDPNPRARSARLRAAVRL